MKSSIIISKDENDLIERLWDIIKKASDESAAKNATFRIGLSGGSLINFLAAGADKYEGDWSKWQLFFCDERFVDYDNEHSTFGQYKKLFIPKTKLTESQFITIDRSKSLKDCARSYEEAVLNSFAVEKGLIPEFDLLLLGMGPDGHTCSLFPGHPLLSEQTALIAPISDSPKPPPERVTMTYPLINNAKICLFPISGKGKAAMVKEVFAPNSALPSALVSPTAGKLIWLLDEGAASEMK